MEGSDTQAEGQVPEANEEHPAADQSPVATDAQKAITGDHGLDQQPSSSLEHVGQDRPVATSAPPAESQSGVPLAEDRAAGVQPGEPGVVPGPVRTAEQVEADEQPEGTD